MPSRHDGAVAERAALRQQKAEQRQNAAIQRMSEQRAAEAHNAAKIQRLRALRLARDEAAAQAIPDQPAPRPTRKTRSTAAKATAR